MPPIKRTNFTADIQIQGGASRRLVIYWAWTWLAVFALPIVARSITSELPFSALAMSLVRDMWFPMVMSFLILPIIAWDHYRFMHRITGPVKRIGLSLQAMANGQKVLDIKLRKEDFCQQLAQDFNRLNAGRQDSKPVRAEREQPEEALC